MNKKAIIQTTIVIIAFGASGIILYNGLFKNSVGPVPNGSLAPITSSANLTSSAILPHGDKLDFKPIYTQDLRFGDYIYPSISTTSDVSIPLQNLIKSLSTEQKP
jgi:hypothetical protein